MPSPPHEDIPISDKLKDAGVTGFWKVGDAVLQIQLGKRLVSFLEIVYSKKQSS